MPIPTALEASPRPEATTHGSLHLTEQDGEMVVDRVTTGAAALLGRPAPRSLARLHDVFDVTGQAQGDRVVGAVARACVVGTAPGSPATHARVLVEGRAVELRFTAVDARPEAGFEVRVALSGALA